MNVYNYNPGQKVLGTKTHFAKLSHILPLKKAWGCCYKGLFLLSLSPPSSVDRVELKLEYITSTPHRLGRGEGRCLDLTSYCVSVPIVLTRVVVSYQLHCLLIKQRVIFKILWTQPSPQASSCKSSEPRSTNCHPRRILSII